MNSAPISSSSSVPSARRLRGFGPLIAAAWSIVKARGLAIVTTAALVWILFAVVAAALLTSVADMPRLGDIFANLTAAADNPLAASSATSDLDALTSGAWLRHGWGALGAAAIVLAFVYMACAATASIAVTEQSYRWLIHGEKASVLGALRHGVRRALPGAALLSVYYFVVAAVLLVGMALGAIGGYIVTRAVVGDEPLAEIVAAVGGGLLGFLAAAGVAAWVYTIWSVSPYAVALSSRPWGALGQSQRLTRGNRLDVFIRVLLVTLAVAMALAVATLPVDLLLGLLPFAGGGIVSLLLALYVRAMISALSPLVTTSSLMTMYVDLGGEVPSSTP